MTDNPVADLVRAVRATYEPTLRRLLTWIVGEPDPPLPPFGIAVPCPKCEYWPTAPGVHPMRLVRILSGDAIERTCSRCGATWLMQCADAEEAMP